MKTSVKSIKKSQYVQTRIDPDVKEKTEGILKSLGISPSQAINMFYYQISIQNRIPFDLSVPDFMSAEEERKVSTAREQLDNGEYVIYDPEKDNSLDLKLEENV